MFGKMTDISVIYGITAVLAILLFAGYVLFTKKKEYKMTFLFLDIVR